MLDQPQPHASADKYERARETIWNLPGFQKRASTITTPGFSLYPQATWIVETIRTDDQYAIFLQMIDKEGGQRLVLPEKVCRAIYSQHNSIMKVRRSERAKRGAETRKRKEAIKNIPPPEDGLPENEE